MIKNEEEVLENNNNTDNNEEENHNNNETNEYDEQLYNFDVAATAQTARSGRTTRAPD
jgi:hypothetical protein